MRFLRRSVLGLFLLIATVGLLAYAALTVRDAAMTRAAEVPRERPVQERTYTVEVVTPTAERAVPVLTAYGTVEPGRTVTLRAPAPGRVITVASGFAEGGRVTEGSVVLRIDPTDAEAAVARAETDLDEARAEARAAAAAIELTRAEVMAAEEQVALRTRALDRRLDLAARNVGATAAVDDAELALSSAEQTVLARRQALASAEARVDRAAIQTQRAELALREARRALADTTVTAPFKGQFADVARLEGRLVSQGEELGLLIDPDRLEVAFRVSAGQFARLIDETGRPRSLAVRAQLDVADISLVAEGQLDRAAAQVAPGETGRVVYATLDAAAGFKPGDFVTVRIDEPPLDRVVRLPASALDSAGTVLVLDDADRLVERPVTLLRRQGDDVLVAADTGIVGARVVATRTPLLGEGILVRPLVAPEPQASAPEAAEGDVDTMLALSDDRRAALRAAVADDGEMPQEAKARILAQLDQPMVSARVVARLERRLD